ncbi:3-isopropylmalate dehydratase small subunit [Mailhella massiliensis]|uniref:3-isopropylmalate dehydratase small subunit n=1 Tax=Mailhella massiliensis TaxID=1903261 RepID=A0A921AZ18_9BACT|nr:3-isopropylmalate dehydratase small subunit [Mailhella massiliensis]HJD98392.1 3-isopropylmalate dehydratase small subunit [Mailhella massiliensis]
MTQHRVWKFGDNVDTDAIIPGRFLANWNSHPENLRKCCFVDVRPEFSAQVSPGDVIVGGRNFGCGSSRESAPVSIRMSGVSMVIAESFGRIFYRNSINIGLLAIVSPDAVAGIRDGDCIAVDLGRGVIRNCTRDEEYGFTPFPSFIGKLVELGGLGPYVRSRLGLEEQSEGEKAGKA